MASEHDVDSSDLQYAGYDDATENPTDTSRDSSKRGRYSYLKCNTCRQKKKKASHSSLIFRICLILTGLFVSANLPIGNGLENAIDASV